MTTMHMDVSGVRAVQRGLEVAASRIEQQIAVLRRNNQGLYDDWIANSANEYHAQFSELEAQLIQIARGLEEISSELSTEIAIWESVDRTFG
jgi:uncharacterized protein YukE